MVTTNTTEVPALTLTPTVHVNWVAEIHAGPEQTLLTAPTVPYMTDEIDEVAEPKFVPRRVTSVAVFATAVTGETVVTVGTFAKTPAKVAVETELATPLTLAINTND